MPDLHFNFNELFHSDEAIKHGWDNTTSDPKKLTKLMQLVWYCLTPIRAKIFALYKVGLNIENAYRSEKLRAFLKASKTGHPEGECADLTCSKLNPYQLFLFIASMAKKGEVEYDQLIYEKDTNCLHIGYRHGKCRHQTMIRTKVNGKYVYTNV